MLAAAPAWFSDNLVLIAGATLVVLTIVVLRMIQKAGLRLALLVLIGVVGVVAYINRAELKACATTCECRLFKQDLTVPGCNPDLKLS